MSAPLSRWRWMGDRLASLGANGGHEVGWFGDHDTSGQTDSEFGLCGRRSAVEALCSESFG